MVSSKPLGRFRFAEHPPLSPSHFYFDDDPSGAGKEVSVHFLMWITELRQRRQRWRRAPVGVERMRAVARRQQSGRRDCNTAGLCE